jgi:hypothetical protein
MIKSIDLSTINFKFEIAPCVKVNSKNTKCNCHKMARGPVIVYRAVGTMGQF